MINSSFCDSTFKALNIYILNNFFSKLYQNIVYILEKK
jgi:hypothetical protein